MWTAGSISSDSDWKPQRYQKLFRGTVATPALLTTAANIRKRPFGLTALRKADEPRVCRRGKNRRGLRAPVQAARPRPPFAKTGRGYPGGRPWEFILGLLDYP